jgi:acetylornithine deacetylase/succinyl-diaminopimelate desuccinylase-like protein
VSAPSAERLGDAAVALTAELIAVDSVNPGLVPGAAGEVGIVELLRRRLDRRGLRTEVVRAAGHDDRPSLLASTGAGDGPRLVLNGHLDTVGVHGMREPFTPRLEGDLRSGRLYGRGACDMKGGVAGLVVAAELIGSEGVAGDVVLALVADEEDASLGTEAVIAHLLATDRRPDACLVGEPTWLDLVVAHRGFAVMEVLLRGVAAHASRPEAGVDAIAHLGRLLAAVTRHDATLTARVPHPLVGTGSLLASVVSGGEAPFTLAGSARAVLERRTLPGETVDDALAEVQALLVELGGDDPLFDPELSLVLAREPWEAGGEPAGTALADAVARSLVASGRDEPARRGAPYWMDSALWGEAGVPTVVCGPAGEGLHAAEEWADLGQLRAYPVAVAELVRQFCGVRSG